jgi:P27 family predicted phage terminase small subunit
MQGRKPDPTALKLIKGNPGKRALPESAGLGVTVAIPPAPPHLKPLAKAEWDRITPHLEAAGLVTNLDMGVLALWCDAWGDYVEARQMIERPAEQGGGWMVKTPNGYEVQSPWVAQLNRAAERLVKCGVEFGFTPSSRARVESHQQPGLFDDDPMEAFLSAGKQA